MDPSLAVLLTGCHSLRQYSKGPDDLAATARTMLRHYPSASGGERTLIRAAFSLSPWLAEFTDGVCAEPFRLDQVSGLDAGNARGLLMAIAPETGNPALGGALQRGYSDRPTTRLL